MEELFNKPFNCGDLKMYVEEKKIEKSGWYKIGLYPQRVYIYEGETAREALARDRVERFNRNNLRGFMSDDS